MSAPGYDAREPRAPWNQKRIVLGVCGGIAAYKIIQVARDLTLLGATVDVVLTEAAREFVTPLSFEGVTGRRPITDLFSAEGAALHVALGRDADCICVAPATADFISRAALGRADDLLTTVLLATEAPVVVAPSMNDRMFAHPQTRSNLDHLENSLGYRRIGPVAGKLAVGEGKGPGRLIDPGEIVEAVGRALQSGGPLDGLRVLVTAGPTRESLDPVRYLGNRSSGKMGYALARSAWRRGAQVTLITGPSAETAPHDAQVVDVETAIEMRDAVFAHIGDVDVAIHAAAVSDYRPVSPRTAKMKRSEEGADITVELTANPDIAAEARSRMKDDSLSVGFALETSDLVRHADEKLSRKGFAFIVANRADLPDAGFEVDTNRATIIEPGRPPEELPVMAKVALAEEIMARVEAHLAGGTSDG